ncbi:uncharacterized protein DNG_09544 [Cephalotrichum gorgonifer]|uniref:Uncharacterized protein n=1 Tax=Cephalotrichum gorgonifer TaxID=2041049 RepID=A0AAE8N8J0_9PEZI|nr:uncharacterized protein DNG_09544 [Cephalotrichum gorgonifer]
MLDPQPRRGPVDSAAVYTHSRTRTSSSGAYNPYPAAPPTYHSQERQQYQQHQYSQQQYQQYQQQQYHQPPQNMQYNRRSPSVNTFSTASTAGPPPAAYRTSPTTDLRRSISSRSGGGSPQPSGYVASLRRQKGTVWCDRAQPEDPHLAAQLRAAKAKASRAMAGSSRPVNATGRTSTGISTTGKVAAKIRHHGKPGVRGYAPGENHVGVGGVPPRLSATEVEGGSSDDEDRGQGQYYHHHRRTGSGRSSTKSERRGIPYRGSGGLGSQRGTPSRQGSLAESIPERMEGPIVVIGGPEEERTRNGKPRSVASASSGERADNIGELGQDTGIASRSRRAADAAKEKGIGLERKGSVDERTSTLTGGKLYIANPD